MPLMGAPELSDSAGDTKANTRARAVFISYASLDSAVAGSVCEALEKAGIACWIAPRDVTPGAFYPDEIVHAIDAAKATVLILSQNAATSHHVLREVERAASKRHPVVSLRIDKAPLPASLEYFLNTSQWLDATAGDLRSALPKLVSAVKVAVKVPAPAQNGAPTSDASAPAVSAGPQRRIALMAASALGLGLLALAADRLWLSRHQAIVPAVPAPAESAPAHKTVAPTIPEKSVAVLPFVDMSEKHDQEYFADGMAEEVIERLSQVPKLRVPGRASSFFFKGKSTKVSDIARELRVANVVEGSVRKFGDHLRIGVQLVRVVDGYTVWSESFDRQLRDVFKVQDEIATAIATALQITLSGGSLSREQGGTRNLEAYQLNLRALHDLNQNTVESINRARAQTERAVHLDPAYGDAWTLLANAWLNLSDHGAATKNDACARMRKSLAQAVTVSPDSSTVHAMLGSMHYECDWNWPAVSLEIQRSLDLDPNNDEPLNAAGQLAMTLGQYDEAERIFRKVLDRDPFALFSQFNLACTLYLAGKYRQAEAGFQHLLEIAPDFGWARPWLAKTLLADGRARESLAVLQPIIDTDDGLSYLPEVLYANGRKAEAVSAVERLEKTEGSAFFVAQYYAYVNDKGLALQWLDRAVAQKDGWVVWILGEPLMANLRDDQPFRAFLRKMNLASS